MSVPTVADDDWQAAVLDAPLPVIVDFHAPWCGPCKPVGALMETLSERHAGRLAVVGVDIDAAPRTAARYQILAVPTVIVFRDGEPVERLTGRINEKRVTKVLAAHLEQE